MLKCGKGDGYVFRGVAILDRNTVDYMVDQMQNRIDEQKKEIEAQQQEIARLKELLAAKGK